MEFVVLGEAAAPRANHPLDGRWSHACICIIFYNIGVTPDAVVKENSVEDYPRAAACE